MLSQSRFGNVSPSLAKAAPHLQRLLLPALLLSSFALNLQLLDRFPLREDEALYSYWALSFRHEDPLMRAVWPDKPPLFIWTQAAALSFFGSSQATARLLNIGLTTLTVAVVAVTGHRLWNRPTGTLAAALVAWNPFVISFAATAYTDPLLLFCGQLALYLAIRGRALGAGLMLAAAIMTKQQGVLYLPLIGAALLWVGRTRRIDGLRLLLGIALVVVPIFYWDSLRWAVAPSPWDLSVRNYAVLTVAAPALWWARVQAWGDLLWYVGGTGWLWSGYGTLVLLLLLQLPRARQRGFHATRASRLSLLLAGWVGAFLLLHITTTIQIWDRYLLPIVPLVMLMLAGGAAARRAGGRAGLLLGCTLLALPTAVYASQGGFPIGGDRGAYQGLTTAVQWLQREEKPFVLYHQRLGWHYRFYLFEELSLAAEERTQLRWFAHAVGLADNAANIPHRTRYYLQPAWHNVSNLRLHLQTRGLLLIEQTRFGKMTLYVIENQPQHPCDWCYCGLAKQHGPFQPLRRPANTLLFSPRAASDSSTSNE